MKTPTVSRLNILALVCFTLLSGCGGSGGGSAVTPVDPDPQQGLVPTPKGALNLKPATSCTALSNYLADSFSNRYLGQYFTIARLDTSLSNAVAPGAPTPFIDFTGTNNAEAGVDEIDVIETDARGHFYIINGDRLVVASGDPDNMQELANLDLTIDGALSGLSYHAESQQLLAVVNYYYVTPLHAGMSSAPASILPVALYNPATELVFIDVADPSAPVVQDRLRFDGAMIAARQIDGRVHLVSSDRPDEPVELSGDASFQATLNDYYQAVNAGQDTTLLKQTIRNAVSAAVAAHHPLEFLPRTVRLASDGTETPLDLLNCEDVSMPDAVVAPGFVSVLSVDMDGANPETVAVANQGWLSHVSKNNVYIAEMSGSWFWTDRQSQESAIYKLSIGAGKPEYKGTGVVGGWVESGFNLNEHEGYLRVATHVNQTDPATQVRTMHNNLFVLTEAANGSLDVSGAVTGYGADERIFAVRYVGDRGYVVTFRQTDPLFAFDLSQPTNPQLLGQVEIPGVSTYLHPMAGNHLLTIGRGGTEAGLSNQLQLQIFNVTDAGNPVLLHAYEPDIGSDEHAWSAAEYDHLAFTYHADSGTLSVPLQVWSGHATTGFSGFLVLQADAATGFTELGRVDHGTLAYDTYCTGDAASSDACMLGYFQDAAYPLRSVLANNGTGLVLYALTTIGLEARAISDLAVPVGMLPLPYAHQFWWNLE